MSEGPSLETTITFGLDALETQRDKHPNDLYLMWLVVVFSILRQMERISRTQQKVITDNDTIIETINKIKSIRVIFGFTKDILVGVGWLITTIIALAAFFK